MSARGRGRGKRRAAAAKLEVDAAATSGSEAVVAAAEAVPVVLRTHASKISAAAIEQALATTANSESPANEKPASAEAASGPTASPEKPADAEARESRPTVDSSTLHESTDAADLVSLPRTTSEEWMAADADDGAYERETRRRRWMIPAVVATIGVIGIVVMVAFNGNTDSAPRSTVAAHEERVGSAADPGTPIALVQADAAVVAVAVTPVDAEELVTAAMDATSPTVVPIDASVLAVEPIDAPVVALAPPDAALVVDAGTRVATVPVDAAVPAALVASKATTKPDTKPKVPAPPKDERTIEELVDASAFAKANTACATNTMFSTPRLVACAVAACNTHSDALAARWIRAIPRASRDDIVAKCKALGVEVATP